MAVKKRTLAAQAAERGPVPAMPAELIEQLVQGPMTPSEAQDLILSLQKAAVLTDIGTVRIEVPRDRQGNFVPVLIPSKSGALPASMTRSSPCMTAA